MSHPVPPEMLQLAGIADEATFKLEFARWLYDKERNSMGRARKLAGLDQVRFQRVLAEREIYIKYTEEDIALDLQHARDAKKVAF